VSGGPTKPDAMNTPIKPESSPAHRSAYGLICVFAICAVTFLPALWRHPSSWAEAFIVGVAAAAGSWSLMAVLTALEGLSTAFPEILKWHKKSLQLTNCWPLFVGCFAFGLLREAPVELGSIYSRVALFSGAYAMLGLGAYWSDKRLIRGKT
jgi:hypothetical protein